MFDAPPRLSRDDVKFLLNLAEFRPDTPLENAPLGSLHLPPHEKVRVGVVTHRDEGGQLKYMITLYVTFIPSIHFWEADVRNFGDGKARRVSFGSGSLSRYWPHLEAVASGMMDVHPI